MVGEVVDTLIANTLVDGADAIQNLLRELFTCSMMAT